MKWPLQAAQAAVDSPLGTIHLCATPTGLAGAWFHDQRHRPEDACFGRWPVNDNHPVLLLARQQLTAYFANARRSAFDLPLDLSPGTDFQREVWSALQRIPSGQTLSYLELAHQLGRPTAVRAVAAAIGRNPVSVVIPCHRVVGSNGALTGYAGGLTRKRALLRGEHAC
ncbi:MAG TPA: methylated-DNA--[protein]-cysteine S-methyltransferase [Hydrogenophaga sp.]